MYEKKTKNIKHLKFTYYILIQKQFVKKVFALIGKTVFFLLKQKLFYTETIN